MLPAAPALSLITCSADLLPVQCDQWRSNRSGKHKDDAHALSAVYVKAGKAMLVTSVTTVISFFANLSSEFVGIASFGSYAGDLT